MDPDVANAFRRDFGAAQQDVQIGVVSSRARAASSHWQLWEEFCHKLAIDPTLQEFQDPVPFLQVFARRYRTGDLAPRKKPVRSRTVEDALRSVGQTFTGVGGADPRITTQGKLDFRLQPQFACYSKQDPPPDRVKPIPLAIIHQVLAAALLTNLSANLAIVDMIVIAFFFLLRRGEYTGTHCDTTPFRFADVQLFAGLQRLDLPTAMEAALRGATFVSLTFTTQNNCVRGKVIGVSRSGEAHLCPVVSVVQRVLHLHNHGAPATTPLATYSKNASWHPIQPAAITSVLCIAATILGPSLGFLPDSISARSL
jgi:hypothetical protein